MSRRATRALSAIPPRAPKTAAPPALASLPQAFPEWRVQRRRTDLFAAVDRADEEVRKIIRRIEASRPGFADAMWDAAWQLRAGVARCAGPLRATRTRGAAGPR